VLVLILAILWLHLEALAQERPKEAPAPQVLILHSHRADLPSNVILNETLRSTLSAGWGGAIDFYTEYLDVTRFPGAEHAKLQSEALRRRYADKKPDVVITISDPAIDFLVTIRTTSQPEAGRLAIAISDTGGGVKDTDLERIFEHFVSSKPQGLGMGLAISRSIVEAHGGRIWVTRNPDRGLTLHVDLPTRPRGR
jgi:hypothetical protein